jgi:hypothetical protein
MGAYEFGCTAINKPGVPLHDEFTYDKNRYLSFRPMNSGRLTALRVALTGTNLSWWVGPPSRVCENSGQVAPPDPNNPPNYGCSASSGPARTFMAAELSCSPHSTDWTAALNGEALHVFGQAVVPSSTYEISAIDSACDIEEESNYSSPLAITTAKWGDIVGAEFDQQNGTWPRPNGVVESPDIVAMLDKFKNYVGSPIKSRADIDPSPVDRLILSSDISRVLDAFENHPYPFSAPAACGSGGGGGGGGGGGSEN